MMAVLLLSRPAIAGRGDRAQRGGRGVGRDACLMLAPPPPCSAWSPSPASRGRIKRSHSRNAPAPEGCRTTRRLTPPSTIASRLNRRWDRFFGSIMLGAHLFRMALRLSGLQQQIKGSRTPPGACLPMVRAIRARLALIAARSPDGVPPRYLRPRANAAAQLQNALPGTWLSAGVTRRPLSQSSDKVADRSSCRPGVFPLAARERR